MIGVTFEWKGFPAPTPLHTVECNMVLPFGAVYACKLNGADFLPAVAKSCKKRTRLSVEVEMLNKFLRFIGAA